MAIFLQFYSKQLVLLILIKTGLKSLCLS